MGLGNGAVSKDKKTEKEKKKERQDEVKEIVAQIRALMRQEQATSADSPDWAEFENALTGFLNGNIKGNAATLSIKLLDNIQQFAKGRKNFIESAKGQQIAQKLHQEMSKVPGAWEDPQAAPLITFLGHLANGEANSEGQGGGKKKEAAGKDKDAAEKARKALAAAGWEFAFEGPKKITVEEGKKEQEEAMEAVRKLHKDMGIKSPEEIKKEQNQTKGMV